MLKMKIYYIESNFILKLPPETTLRAHLLRITSLPGPSGGEGREIEIQERGQD